MVEDQKQMGFPSLVRDVYYVNVGVKLCNSCILKGHVQDRTARTIIAPFICILS